MSETEIRKIWGADSETKFNIMRVYIPTGSTTNPESSWSQALTTVKLAKSMGLIVLASPWSMPAAWKTNNSTNGISNGTVGYLKEANYGDYAAYLNRFVTLMRDNGAELDAISIQNESDFDATYAGCHWTPAQITNFLKGYRSAIDCKVIAPETMNIGSSTYVNAMAANDVIDQYDIYAGHQYGWNGSPTSLTPLSGQGKEIWMTEYLLNWAPDGTALANVANFNWAVQGFDFAKAVNTGLLANESAWIHYAAKRYYGLIGDGYGGTVTGAITKRGYILAQYAKYVTGATRIENTWNDAALTGSAYLSATGDSVIVVVINSSNNAYSLTVDLPFYSTAGKSITTTETTNMAEVDINIAEETNLPKADISASSVTTLIFTKSNADGSSLLVKDTPAVLYEEYYTLLGQRAYPGKNNIKGIYIVKSFMSDGSVNSRKIYVK